MIWQLKKSNILDSSFDIYTISFGLRNVTDIERALMEAYRVLKPGGRVMILEFSTPKNDIFKRFYDRYSFDVIPLLGKLIANDKKSYQYLVCLSVLFSYQYILKTRRNR